MKPWLHGFMASWLHGFMASWFHGFMLSFFHEIVVANYTYFSRTSPLPKLLIELVFQRFQRDNSIIAFTLFVHVLVNAAICMGGVLYRSITRMLRSMI